MKIGITCHPSAGGSGILATELGIALANRGHDIHFVTDEAPFRLQGFHQNIYSHFVEQVTYPLFRNVPYSLSLASKICEVAEEFDIEVWHAHYAIPNAAAAILARHMLPEDKRFCLVTTLHGTDITLVGSHPSFYRITKFAMEESCAVTAVSKWLNDETHRQFQLEKPIETIYNFYDPDKFQSAPKKSAPFAKKGEKIIMHISNFRPVKRVTDVVRAFKKITEQVDARLVMVGEGPERMAAVSVGRQLGLTDKISYLGVCGNIEEILPTADLVFQPSEHESFGLVPLEAMACGVPVLGTASGGIVEVVEHGLSGYLCEVGDIESMAKFALEILSNPQKAAQMGQHGRDFARNKFHRDLIISQYESLYKEIRKQHQERIAKK